MSGMDTEYLKAAVGDALSTGIAETVLMRPEDPVDYLAQRLLKWVDDSYANTEKIAGEEAAKAAEVTKADVAAVAEREASKKAKDETTKVEKEDARLANLLGAATSSSEVLTASLEYLRVRLGASAYVAMTDLPDKLIPLEEPKAEGEGEAGAAEGEEGAAAEGEAPAAEEAAEPPAEPAEGEEPPPPREPFVPKVVVYEAATENDKKTLVGKKLSRPAKPAGEEDNEEAVPVRGQNEGVIFDALDAFVKDASAPPLHIPEVVQNPSVKFWYIPRTGAFVVKPFADYEGDAKGAICLDTLGLGLGFSEENLALVSEVAAKVGAALDGVERKLLKKYNEDMEKIGADWEANREELTKALEEATAAEAAEEPDPLATLKAKAERAKLDCGLLTGDQLTFTETRKAMPPDALTAFKAAMAVLSADAKGEEIATLSWEELKAQAKAGSLPWGQDLFDKLAAFSAVDHPSDSTAFATAAKILKPEEESPDIDLEALKAAHLLGFLMLTFVKENAALFAAKVEKEKADAEAAAAKAAEEAAAAEAAAAEAAAAEGEGEPAAE